MIKVLRKGSERSEIPPSNKNTFWPLGVSMRVLLHLWTQRQGHFAAKNLSRTINTHWLQGCLLWGRYFPTWQVRVVGFYVSHSSAFSFSPAPQPRAPDGSVPTQTSTASSWWQRSCPDLNRELPAAVFPTGPQPRSPDSSAPTQTSTASSNGSVPARTSTASSTASSRWQCSPLELNRELPTAVFPPGPQVVRTYVR